MVGVRNVESRIGRATEDIATVDFSKHCAVGKERLGTYISYELLSFAAEPTAQNSERGGGTEPVAVW